jgi:hypothetical protein
MNHDVIAKNLLENKICSTCKFYSSTNRCYRIEPIEIEAEADDVEVYVNGLIQQENVAYLIQDNKVILLQHVIQPDVAVGQGIINNDTILITTREIKDGKIIKKKYTPKKDRELPHEQTCEGFLDLNKPIYYRS